MDCPTCMRLFGNQLLDNICAHENEGIAAASADEKLSNESCSFCGATLLHYAAAACNEEILRALIESGSNVNAVDRYGRTPISTAFQRDDDKAVKMLLEAGADVDNLDGKSQSVLRMVLAKPGCALVDMEIIHAFYSRLKAEVATGEELVELLVAVGFSSWYHAILTRDTEMVMALQRRLGFDLHSRNTEAYNKTALHIAARVNDLNMVRFLVGRGADVNALVPYTSECPLFYAGYNANLAMMQLLLDNGADPQQGSRYDTMPLYGVIIAEDASEDEQRECVEFLIEHGVYRADLLVFVEEVIDNFGSRLVDSWHGLDSLIAHVAILETNGLVSRQEVMQHHEYHAAQPLGDPSLAALFLRLEKYYDGCRKMLRTTLVDGLTLSDLLYASELEIRPRARDDNFTSALGRFSSRPELTDLYPYYRNRLIKCISKAARCLALENMAIGVICDLFDCGYNQLNIFARQVVTYLPERDLEQLCLVNVDNS